MIKKIIAAGFIYSLSVVSFACPHALATDNPAFCSSFKTAAVCHCTASGLPFGICQDMHVLYNRMIIIFKTLEKACEYQHHTSTQECVDNWRCYLVGGVDSQGRPCSSNQHPCE